MQPKIIIGLPAWRDNESCAFAGRLAGGLAGIGWDARILLTETGAVGVVHDANESERPAHLAFEDLPCGKQDPWHMRWEALLRYLEERAPCVFITMQDWRNSVVAPRLSNRVYVIALVASDDDLERDQLNRLGDSFNAIVAPNAEIHFNLAHECPLMAPRMITIQDGNNDIQSVLNAYTALFARMQEMVRQEQYVRGHWLLPAPPVQVGGRAVFTIPDPSWEEGQVNLYAHWPNAVPPTAPAVLSKSVPAAEGASLRLEDYKIIAAIPGGQISGVDIFACHLIRRLRQHGLDAKILGARVLSDVQGLPLANDLPVEGIPLYYGITWLARWELMIEYLEANAPCIYIPNYDYDYSGVCPRLSDRVKVVNIAHSDDPVHYEHSVRLGRVSNAIVGVSKAIVGHLAGLDPTLMPRLHHIPYGIEVPSPLPARTAATGAPLRIIYVGRLANYQKRVSDLIDIAQGLADRNIPFELTIVGEGVDRERLYSRGKKLILQRSVWFPGKLNNDEVMEFLRASDVFLLPSSFEGLSVGLLEAMAHGAVPIVSNMRSGVPDVIRDGHNGFIAPIGDIDRYVDHLAYLYHHPEQRIRMARAAVETICSGGFNLDDMVQSYIDLFREVIAHPFTRPIGPILPPNYLLSELAWRKQTFHHLKKSVRSARSALRDRKKKGPSK